MEDKLIDKTLDRIKAEQIKPKPRWEHLLFNAGKWTLFGACGLVGAIGLVFIFNILAGADWDMHPRLGFGLFRLILLSLPPFWVVLMVSAIVLAYVVIRNTRYGYRYEAKHVMLMIFGLVAVIGLASFFFRADDFLERRMPRMMHGYDRANQMQQQAWSNPENGMLGGTVITFDDGSRLIMLKDFSGQDWRVEMDKQARIQLPVKSQVIGTRLKMMGEKIGELHFRAAIIRPWNDRFERMPGGSGRPMMRMRVVPQN